MKTKQRGFISLLVIAAVVLVVAAAGVGLYISSKNKTVTQNYGNENNEVNKSDSLSGQNSLQTLFGLGQNLKCTFNSETDGNVNSGVMYIANKGDSLRGDFTNKTSAGATVTGHMIKQGNVSYMWSDNRDQGFKSEWNNSLNGTSTGESNNNVDLNQKVNYQCQAWDVDDNLFTPPSNIKFMPMGGTMMNSNINTNVNVNTSVKASQCAACNNLSGSSKTQCLSALNCY